MWLHSGSKSNLPLLQYIWNMFHWSKKQMEKLTWPEGDVEILGLDLGDILRGPCCFVAEGPVFNHLQFAGWRLQSWCSTARCHQVTLQITTRRAGNPMTEILTQKNGQFATTLSLIWKYFFKNAANWWFICRIPICNKAVLRQEDILDQFKSWKSPE